MKTPKVRNLLPAPDGRTAENITPLLDLPVFRLEHIVSRGQASPEGFWYDQPRDEWVVLLRGTAKLEFGGVGARELRAGDALLIPAHEKHRVASVSGDAVWLALHFEPSETPDNA